MRITRLVAAALISSALAGCVAGGGTSPTPSPSPDAIGLGVVNGTDLRVSIVVNTTVIETIAPQSADKAILMSVLPPLPWVVQARTSSGRVLVTMTAGPGDVQGPAEIGQLHTAKYSAVDLSCGELSMWTGAIQPTGGGPPGSGSSGDCQP
jgi:hypothetical protein